MERENDDYNKLLEPLVIFNVQIWTQDIGARDLGKIELNTPDFSNSKFIKPNAPKLLGNQFCNIKQSFAKL